MTGHIGRSGALRLGLGGLCLGLAGVIGQQIHSSISLQPATSTPVAAISDAAEMEVPEAFELGPLMDYGDVIARPLFIEGRRPAIDHDQVQKEVAAVAPTSIRLVGIIDLPTGKLALIEHGTTTRIQRIAPGKDIGGWKLEEIGRDRIIVAQGDAQAEIKIKDRAMSNGSEKAQAGERAAKAPNAMARPPTPQDQSRRLSQHQD